MREITIGRRTVRANPNQSLGYDWKWGKEWRIGNRRGRWAVQVVIYGWAEAVRVEWDSSLPIRGDRAFTWHELIPAVGGHSDGELADLEEKLNAELDDFDAMARDLWERREKVER
jgi:hypothetical protein